MKYSSLMSSYWMGCVILGLAYLIGFDYSKDAIAFVVGQVVMGLIGLYREYSISRQEIVS